MFKSREPTIGLNVALPLWQASPEGKPMNLWQRHGNDLIANEVLNWAQQNGDENKDHF